MTQRPTTTTKKGPTAVESVAQVLREPCDLPLVKLSERDEQLLFDAAVRIRYGDYKTLAETCLDLESHMLRDFPLECFLQKPGGQDSPVRYSESV